MNVLMASHLLQSMKLAEFKYAIFLLMLDTWSEPQFMVIFCTFTFTRQSQHVSINKLRFLFFTDDLSITSEIYTDLWANLMI